MPISSSPEYVVSKDSYPALYPGSRLLLTRISNFRNVGPIANRPYPYTPWCRTSNNAETERMETAVETRMALEVRAT